MEHTWEELYNAAKKVQGGRDISERIYAGSVAAAIETAAGNIYTGISVDTSCTLGICAERNAMFNMITNGEHEIRKVLAILPDGNTGAPCGACREFMMQLMHGHASDVRIMLDYENSVVVTLEDLTPNWWI
ncbi:MAG: cytidine deaminase [Eubacteriaceae bacterium]|nr:cytidine deaminase [Eubacteriaceae bacterium]